jgi:hypothetical protein
MSFGAAFGAALAFGAVSVAGTAAASNLSCYWAINSACGGAGPHGHSVKACFETHSSRLSRSCGARLPHFVAVTHRCDADQRRLCGHATRAEAGASCRAALAKVGIRSPSRR